MGRYSGIKFVCRSPGDFEVVPEIWNYYPNLSTSLIKTTLVGMCNSDFSRLFKGSNRVYPITPGHEIVGRLEESESGLADALNSDVCVFPLIPCQKCPSCLEEDYNLCADYSYLGSRENGALSTYLEVPNWNIIRIPPDANKTLLPMIEPLSVIFHAFDNLKKEPSKVLITGSGFLSYLALLIAKYLGHTQVKIISTSMSARNLFEGYFFEAEEGVERAFDYCIDLSGNNLIMNRACKLLKPKSLIVSLANLREDTYLDSQTRDLIVRKELKYQGSWNSSISDSKNNWLSALKFLCSNQELLYPIRILNLDELPEYLYTLESNTPKERIHVKC